MRSVGGSEDGKVSKQEDTSYLCLSFATESTDSRDCRLDSACWGPALDCEADCTELENPIGWLLMGVSGEATNSPGILTGMIFYPEFL